VDARKGIAILPLLLAGAVWPYRDAEAVPGFARKYRASCRARHAAHPGRNVFGETLRITGFQWPAEHLLHRRFGEVDPEPTICASHRTQLTMTRSPSDLRSQQGALVMPPDRNLVPSVLLIAVLAVLGCGIARAGTVTGTVTATPGKYAANVVVYVEGVKGATFKPPAEPAVMDQRNMAFVPHVLPIVAGTTVEFKNSDNVAHNVFSPDKCAGQFNLGNWPPGESKLYTFKKAGCAATILCIVHPDMKAYVVVLQNPYFAVTGADGAFELDGVPAGTYALRAWSEKFSSKPLRISVPMNSTVKAAFTLK